TADLASPTASAISARVMPEEPDLPNSIMISAPRSTLLDDRLAMLPFANPEDSAEGGIASALPSIFPRPGKRFPHLRGRAGAAAGGRPPGCPGNRPERGRNL